MELNVSDIPQSLLDIINEQFERDERVRHLRVQQQMYSRCGKFAEALSVAKRLEALRNKCVYEYMSEAEREVSEIDISSVGIPLSDKEELMNLLLVCFMCGDIIESSIMDMNDLLHKHDKSLSIEKFDDIRSLMRMCKEKLKYLQKNSGYMKDLVWGYKCDDMFLMLKNKARSIMRKRKNDPNYGKNTEKFNQKH